MAERVLQQGRRPQVLGHLYWATWLTGCSEWSLAGAHATKILTARTSLTLWLMSTRYLVSAVLRDVFQALMIRVCDWNSKMRAYFCDEPNEGSFSEIFVRYLSWRSLCIFVLLIQVFSWSNSHGLDFWSDFDIYQVHPGKMEWSSRYMECRPYYLLPAWSTEHPEGTKGMTTFLSFLFTTQVLEWGLTIAAEYRISSVVRNIKF